MVRHGEITFLPEMQQVIGARRLSSGRVVPSPALIAVGRVTLIGAWTDASVMDGCCRAKGRREGLRRRAGIALRPSDRLNVQHGSLLTIMPGLRLGIFVQQHVIRIVM